MMNSKRMAVLKKVIESGYADEKSIAAITAEQMTKFCRSIDEISNVVELQKAVKANKIISYLAGNDISKGKEAQDDDE